MPFLLSEFCNKVVFKVHNTDLKPNEKAKITLIPESADLFTDSYFLLKALNIFHIIKAA